MKDLLDNAKSLIEIVRDVLIGIFIGLIFFSPGCINKAFNAAGVQSAEIAGITWKSQASRAGGEISNAKQGVQDVAAVLTDLSGKTKDPAVANIIKDAASRLKLSEQSINSADESIKSSVEQVQKTEPKESQPKSVDGWIFLGHITEDKKWTYANAHLANGADPPLMPEAKIVLANAGYVRGPTPAGQHATGQVTGVIAAGTTVEVLEIDTSSHALQGGWFVWARVRSA